MMVKQVCILLTLCSAFSFFGVIAREATLPVKKLMNSYSVSRHQRATRSQVPIRPPKATNEVDDRYGHYSPLAAYRDRSTARSDSLAPYEGPDLEKWYATPSITSWDTKAYQSFYVSGMAMRILFPKGFVDDTASNIKYPVLLYLHGYGDRGPTSDNETQLHLEGEYFKKLVDQGIFKGIVVFPQNESGYWNFRDLETLHKTIEYLVRFKKADPYQIILRGYSFGADGVWRFMKAYPLQVSSAICLSAVAGAQEYTMQTFSEIPVWLLQGAKDYQQEARWTHIFVDNIKKARAPMKYTEYATAGHEVSKQNQHDPDLIPFITSANKLNPTPVYSNHQSVPPSHFPTLTLSSGFPAYEWRRNKITLSGENSHTLHVHQAGVYDARVRQNGEWSYWSPIPVEVSARGQARKLTLSVIHKGL